MGGAVRVPGNLGDGGYFKTDNKTAEWNFFADPLAARRVLHSGVRIRLVPLDATSKVPIDLEFLRGFRAGVRTRLGRFVLEILESARVEEGFYYAWDPLVAVSLVRPEAVTARPMAIEVRQNPPEAGRTVEVTGARPNASTAVDANASLFKEVFFGAFAARRQSER